jgi:hypothetical protein
MAGAEIDHHQFKPRSAGLRRESGRRIATGLTAADRETQLAQTKERYAFPTPALS